MLHHPGSSLRFPNGRSTSPRARALPPYTIEPVWEQFEALLPERTTDHPLGCHRRRIPDRAVFGKLVRVLVFGCAYERIADGSCSESTLRRGRDEWVELGLVERLRLVVLDAYDRFIGLDLSEMAVDCCITEAPCGGEKSGRGPVGRGKAGLKRSTVVDARGVIAEDELLAQRPQEAGGVVHRTTGGGRVIDFFWVAPSDVVIIVRRLVREGWIRYRREGRPSRRP